MRLLIIGFGNIGKIHSKYLSVKNVDWSYFDPRVKEPKDKKIDSLDFKDYDRVMICTPEHLHYKNYKEVRDLGFDGYIFIEKPAAVNHGHLTEIFEDKKVIVGMVERFNPAIQTLKNVIDSTKIINIDFSRCCQSTQSSSVSLLEDIGIHDIDLLFYLLELKNIEDSCLYSHNNTIIYMSLNPMSRIIWSKDTFYKERKVIIRQIDCTYEVDLQEQIVKKHYSISNKHVTENIYVEKSSSILNELDNFLSPKPQRIDCYESHKYMLSLLNRTQ
jgi:hypothetical protein